MVCSMCYLGCMVVDINRLFAEWKFTERDYIVAWDSFSHGIHYLFSDIDAVKATFHVLVNTYLLNFRLAMLYWGLLLTLYS